MNLEEEYSKLHYNEELFTKPIYYIGFKVKRALNLIVTDREVRQFGAVEDINDIRTIWEVETFSKASDFYKRIQKYLPMVVTP